MKPISSITIFLCSSSRRLFTRTTLFNSESQTLVGISHFSTSSPDSSASSSYHSSSRRNSEDTRNVRVSVWWDFENCSVPCNVNVFKVTQCITAAVRANGIKGPIQITAFGDVLQLSRSNQEALSSTGINLAHIPHGGKNSADRSLLVDLMYWVSQNPPPAHLFLISGDRDFASVLHRLRMGNYNILLASTDNAPAVLCSAASIMWQWTSLVRGENLIGKHYNQPPDGPFASWYGHYRAPLEDPFAVINQASCLQSEEASDSNSDTKFRPVPKAVVKAIRSILNSYPKGLSITELRSELGKSNVTIEKDLYGHRKFSRFLLSMPYLLKLHFEKDGQAIVYGIDPKSHETGVPTHDAAAGPSTSAKDAVPVMDFKESVGQTTQTTSMYPTEEKVSSPSKLNVLKLSTDSQAPSEKQEEPQQVQEQPFIEKAKEGEVSLGQLHPLKVKRPEVGIIKTIWRNWFGSNDGHQEKICDTVDEGSTSQDNPEKVKPDVKCVQSTSRSSDSGRLPPSSLLTNEGIRDAEIALKRAENANESSKIRGILNQIVRWCKFWKSDENYDNLNAEFGKSDKEITSCSEMQGIFTELFWNDMLAFLETPEGSAAILQSKTRLEIVQKLQKSGPPQIQSLSESHILHLVDLLISEKKWVSESPTRTSPFRLTRPAKSKPFNSKQPTKKNESTEPDSPNRAHVGDFKRKPLSKTRNQILTECQKLVNEVVKEYPDGFNISSFEKLFLDRYGYPLEVQQLSYEKVATLLQMMPGVKLESNYILPSGNHSKNSRQENTLIIEEHPKSESSRKEDDNDSQWEELGPVNPEKDDKRAHHDFEMLSDNELSDSEDDSPSRPTGLENRAKRGSEEDSLLLQVLDSYYSNKDSDLNIDHSNVNRKPSSLHGEAKRNGLRTSKRYSFVAERQTDDKERLINGILGSLKKSSDGSPESKLES